MISCFAFDRSRTISADRPSKMSSSSWSSLAPILRSIGNEASTQVSTILYSRYPVPLLNTEARTSSRSRWRSNIAASGGRFWSGRVIR